MGSRYSLLDIQSVFETGHERAAYALRISRNFLSVHPRHATKARFSDDNLLIRSILHFFVSFFSLSPFFYETLHLAYHSYSISFVFCRAQRLAYHFYSVSASFCHTQWLAKVFEHLRYIEKFYMGYVLYKNMKI